MSQERSASLRKADALVVVALLTLLTWTYLGFFEPDPYVLEKGRAIQFLHYAILVAFPVATAALLFLYVALRTKRIAALSVILAGCASLLALLFAYPVAAWVYDGSFGRQLGKFHPYLQLIPPSFEPRPSDAEPFKVFCLGGSTTERGDDSGRGWPERLEERLRGSRPGRAVQFHNLGREWYTTQHTLINYALNLRPARPDAIIVMQSVNDLLVNADFSYMSKGAFRGDYGHFLGPETRIIHRKSFPEFAGQMFSGLWYHTPREEVVTDEFPGLASYRRNVETIIALAKLDGTQVVLMSEPFLFKKEMSAEERRALHMINYEAIGPTKAWGTETARVGMEKYNAAMRELAQKHGLQFIDLDSAVPKTLDYFKDEVHYQPKAYDVIADFVAKQLVLR